MADIIFQAGIFKDFLLPFILMFFILFAILEKTKILGSGRTSLNSWTALILSLIFVIAVRPTQIVNNLVLFVVVASMVIFVGFLLWGFLIGDEPKVTDNTLRWIGGIVILLAVIVAVFWASGLGFEPIKYLFTQSWSKTFWTNALMLAILVIGLIVVLKSGGGGSEGGSDSGDSD